MNAEWLKFTRNARELHELDGDICVVGLTGGIASGKTVATEALARAGFYIVDADEISRKLTARGTPVESAICKMFPSAVADGKLDRRKLRDAIAIDAEKKRMLEDLTHPLIASHVKLELKKHKKAVLSAPLLFETALARLCDRTVCVTCPKSIRIDRIVARDGVTRDEAERMIAAQIPDLYRATLADFCVPSDRDRSEFEEETVELFDFLLRGDIDAATF